MQPVIGCMVCWSVFKISSCIFVWLFSFDTFSSSATLETSSVSSHRHGYRASIFASTADKYDKISARCPIFSKF